MQLISMHTKCSTWVIVRGTGQYYPAWVCACTNFVHSAQRGHSAGTVRNTPPMRVCWNGYSAHILPQSLCNKSLKSPRKNATIHAAWLSLRGLFCCMQNMLLPPGFLRKCKEGDHFDKKHRKY